MTHNKRGALIAATALVVLLAVGLVAYRRLSDGRQNVSVQTSGSPEAQVGEDSQGPLLADYDATVYTAEGVPVQLTALGDGKPLVINFWATWCPYCVQELPDFQRLAADYAGRVSFAFVNCTDGSRETQEGAMEWLASNGFSSLPVYYDLDLAASAAFGTRSLPTTAIVSSDGRILGAGPGVVDYERIGAILDTLV